MLPAPLQCHLAEKEEKLSPGTRTSSNTNCTTLNANTVTKSNMAVSDVLLPLGQQGSVLGQELGVAWPSSIKMSRHGSLYWRPGQAGGRLEAVRPRLSPAFTYAPAARKRSTWSATQNLAAALKPTVGWVISSNSSTHSVWLCSNALWMGPTVVTHCTAPSQV